MKRRDFKWYACVQERGQKRIRTWWILTGHWSRAWISIHIYIRIIIYYLLFTKADLFDSALLLFLEIINFLELFFKTGNANAVLQIVFETLLG